MGRYGRERHLRSYIPWYVFEERPSHLLQSPRALELIQEKEARADEMTNQWMQGWRETQKILQEQKTLGLRKSGGEATLRREFQLANARQKQNRLHSTHFYDR